ncbi:response regulator [Ideonella sp. BN130291]|uniref:response regulator n=1 Tax=Ideonella sp. BN130291 TaxID=3112940 RepID=UPI002E269DB3|nr:response regulator [Ideonella sp. BN130291]
MDILLISDQPLTVLALRAVLSRHQPVANVVDATHMAEAMTLLNGKHSFGLLVLDLDTHGVRAVSTTALLREMWPHIPMALLASSECDSTIVRSVDLGVSGYVLKTADTDTLRQAFKQMLAGNVYMPEFSLEA